MASDLQPIGATFLAAISILGIVAVIQLLAVAVYYLPTIRGRIAESAVPSQTDQSTAPLSTLPQQPAQSTPQPTPLSADLLRAQKLFAEVEKLYRVGDFEEALKKVDEVDALMPNTGNVQLRRGQILENLEQYPEAADAYRAALTDPEMRPDYRKQAEARLAQIEQHHPAAATKSGATADAGQAIPDPTGLQPGANLGIVDARLRDSKPGMKSLRVAVKSRPGVTINIPDVKIFIYFYEETEDGEVVGTDSQVLTQWLSPPVDWAADEPELLDGQYTLPESGLPGSSSANGVSGRKYFGYVVAVYYNKELQDLRSEPAKLIKDFPVPLFLQQ